MAKKKKIRADFRKNRGVRTRPTDWTRQFDQHGFEEQDPQQQERISGKDMKEAPKVFYVNYFLKDDDGKFLNTKMDKKVWVRWVERRINQKVDAYATPIGFIPKFEDLAEFFTRELGTTYSQEDYERQFTIRVRQLLDKLDAVEEFYKKETSAVPQEMFAHIDIQRRLLIEAEKKHGSDISPFKFKDYAVPTELADPVS